MLPDLKVPRERDASPRGIARRAKVLLRRTSGSPPVPDDDETTRRVPRRPGEQSARRELFHREPEDEE